MKRILGICVCLLASGLIAFAGGKTVVVGDDESAAMKVVNKGDEAVSIVILASGASAANTVTIGSVVNTIDGSGAIDTVEEFAAAIAACTNSVGDTPLTVDTSMALDADSTDGELLTSTNSIAAGAGNSAEIVFDTSAALHYTVACGGGTLRLVMGNLTDCANNYVLSVYGGGNLIFEGASTGVATVIEEDFGGVGLPIGAKILVRATLDSSAATSQLAIVVE